MQAKVTALSQNARKYCLSFSIGESPQEIRNPSDSVVIPSQIKAHRRAHVVREARVQTLGLFTWKLSGFKALGLWSSIKLRVCA